MFSLFDLHLDVHLFDLLPLFRAGLGGRMSGQIELILHITQLIVQAFDSLLLLLCLLFIFISL